MAKVKLQEKYSGLVFKDMDEPFKIYTICDEVRWRRGSKNGGWYVVAEPPEYDGTDDDLLEEFQINEDCLIYMIQEYEQPRGMNVEKILRGAEA